MAFDLLWVVPSLAGLGGSEYAAVTFAQLMTASGHRVRLITGTGLHPAWRERLGKIEVITASDATPTALCALAEKLHAQAPADLIQFMPIEAHCLAWLRRGHVLPVAGWEPTDLSPRCWWLADALVRLIHRLDLLLVLNPTAAQHAVAHYGYQGRIELIPNTLYIAEATRSLEACFSNFELSQGIRKTRLQTPLSQNHSITHTVPIIGCIARLSAEKGLEYLLAAFSLLLEQWPNAELALWGDGEDRERLTRLAKMLGIHSHVRFQGGFDPFDDMDAIAAAADVFVSSSLFEGAPIALLELAARGRPVVATATAGARWICGDDYAWLTPIANTQQMSAALAALLQSAARRTAAGLQLQTRFHQYFSAKQAALALGRAYAGLLQKTSCT